MRCAAVATAIIFVSELGNGLVDHSNDEYCDRLLAAIVLAQKHLTVWVARNLKKDKW